MLLGFYLNRPERLPLAWCNQRTVLGLALCPIRLIEPSPHQRCGTGIRPDRDIAAGRRHMTAPRPSLPTALPAPLRTPAANARVFDVGGEYPARPGLSAGGSRIRTIGTAWRNQGFQRGSSHLCLISCQRKKLVRTRTDTTATLGVFRGTDGSNPVPSSGESGELRAGDRRYLSSRSRRQQAVRFFIACRPPEIRPSSSQTG